MSYRRVIPRDLFNEGNLLKCYGQLYLELEKLRLEDTLAHQANEFEVDQDESDGSISVRNVTLKIRGKHHMLKRPLNARRPFPLYLITEDEDVAVFDDTGALTREMRRCLLEGSSTL